ncbi:S8 family serine peptidase [Flammeovirga pacifica]|nr:S8 family serine peptidase [Flammeovirga pacifica]
MKKLQTYVLILLCCLGLVPIHEGNAQNNPAPMRYTSNGVAKGYLRVKFKPQTQSALSVAPMNTSGVSKIGVADFDATAQQFHAHNMKRVFPYDARNEHKLQRHGLHLWFEIEVDAHVDPQMVVNSFYQVDAIEIAEPRLEKHIIDRGTAKVLETAAFFNEEDTPTTNDPLFSQQWHYHNDGEKSGWSADASIQLLEAWKTTQGTSNVIVSVHDEGVDINHEDLKDNLWVNEAELNGEPGVDSDGNGYIDDVHGYNFAYNRGAVDAQEHGTHVAGTIGAVTNNEKGVAGIAGGTGSGDGVRIMSLQMIGGPNNNTAASYVYAANNGAVISQNSWGYTSAGAYEQAVLDAIDYFIAEAGDYEGSPMKGGLVIFASGNSNIDAQMYPGYYENVMAVASTGPNKTRAYYSNYGGWIDITAPGGDISMGSQNGVLSTLPNNSYGFLQGTSMACPHVSGVAALILSTMGGDKMTPDVLWNQLTASSRNIDSANPNFVGKLGHGLIDAGLAVIENSGNAPIQIDDLVVKGATNNFIRLGWTVPTDEDDGQPSKFEVLYHEGDFNEATATSVIFFNDSTANTAYEVEVKGLKEETSYSFAVRSYDRWGNSSELSETVSTATNLGPDIEVPTNTTYLSVYTSQNNVIEHTHIIKNNSEGILKWNGFARNKYQFKSAYYSVPTVGNVKTGERNISFEKKITPEVFSVKEDPSILQPYENKYLEYVDGIYASIVVGEEDLSISNTTASAFVIEDEEGFNLTEIEVFLNQITNEKAVVEVYMGSILSQAKLVLSEKVNDTSAGLHRVQAAHGEHIYFPYGEVMWIIVRVPSGNQYPIGINPTNANIKDAENLQWFSFDEGKTWQPISNALGFGGYSFCVAGVSKDRHYGEIVTLSPENGEINGVGEQEVTLTIDATKVPNGYVEINTVIASNATENPEARSPYFINVYEHPSNVVTPNIVEVGSVKIGTEKEFVVTINNFGYGGEKNIHIDLTTLEGSDFSIPNTSSWELSNGKKWFATFQPRSATDLKINYTPTVGGNENAIVRLFNDEGWERLIAITAFGIEPSEIDVAPATITHHHNLGEEGNGTVTISNNGNFPLEFVIPKYSNQLTEGIHQFGYSWDRIDTDAPDTEDWKWDELVGADDVIDFSNDFKSNPFLDFVKVDLGFQFPFYDTLVTEMYLSHVGMIAVDDKDPVNGSFGSLLGRNFTSNGYIAFMYEYFDWGLNSKILYKKFDDRVVAQYEQMVPKQENFRSDYPMTFQVVLYYNGNIEMRYKDIGYANSQATDPFVGVESPDKKDGFYIYEFTQKPEKLFENDWTEVMVKVNHPGPQIISNLSKTEGVIGVGESIEITYDVTTDGLVEGLNTQNIAIQSNDPITPISHFTVNVDIMDGGVADISTSEKTINFGTVFRTSEQIHNINFNNNGTAVVDFNSITIDGGVDTKFSVNKSAFQLLPRLGTTVKVILNSEATGVYSDKITFENAEGETFEFTVTATVIDEPQISLDQSPIALSLDAGSTSTLNITVSNADGKSDLEVIPNGSGWLYESTMEAMSSPEIKDFTYAWRDNKNQLDGSIDPNAPVFQWEAIDDSWTRVVVQDLDLLWEPYDLPFTFEFWEEGYDKMWIGYNGIMTFTEPTVPIPLFALDIPNAEAEPHNFIASLWSLTGEDYYDEHPLKGIWVKHDEDRFIITYNRYIHNWGSLGGYVSAQTILYKNGTIRTQYKTIDQAAVNVFNKYFTCGLENKDASDGVVNNFYRPYITDGLVVEYVPAKKTVIPVGEEKTFTFTVDATDLLGGAYHHNLEFTNKTPGKEHISIPVELTVIGTPEFALSEDVIDLGDVLYTPNMWMQKEFTLKNVGTGNLDMTKDNISADDALNMELNINLINAESGIQEVPMQWFGLETIFKWKEICDGAPDPWGGCFGDIIQVEGEYHYVNPNIAPSEELEARITLMPLEAGKMEKSITFMIDGEEHVFTVKANFYEPAQFDMPIVKDIHVDANKPDHTDEYSFSFNNNEGKSSLDWNVIVEYIIDGKIPQEDTEPLAKTSFATSSRQLLAEAASAPIPATYTAIDPADYHEVLSYDQQETPSSSIGYGSASLTTITTFTTPEEGFDLSHVATWMTPKGLVQNEEVVITILGGSIEKPVKLIEKTVAYNKEELPDNGQMMTFDLEKTISFYTGQQIFVAITYPTGMEYPQGIADVSERLENTFFVPTSNGWEDITASPQFEKKGYMVRAMAKTAQEGIWLSIDQKEGSTPIAESTELTLSYDAKYAKAYADYAAKVTILSNDPNHEGTSFYTSMHVNQGPQFQLGDTTFMVYENDTTMLSVAIEEIEGDEYTVTVDGLSDIGSYKVENDTVYITFTPDHTHAGEYVLSFLGEDEHGTTSEGILNVNVIHVNQPPHIKEASDIELTIGDVHYQDPSEIFGDVDGDALTYQIADSGNGVVLVGLSDGQFAFSAITVGISEVAMMATDVHGLTTIAMISVEVKAEDDDITSTLPSPKESSITVYPNPVLTQTTFAFDAQISGNVSLIIHNLQGVQMESMDAGHMNRGRHELVYDASTLPSGIYIYSLLIDGELSHFGKFIKR